MEQLNSVLFCVACGGVDSDSKATARNGRQHKPPTSETFVKNLCGKVVKNVPPAKRHKFHKYMFEAFACFETIEQ